MSHLQPKSTQVSLRHSTYTIYHTATTTDIHLSQNYFIVYIQNAVWFTQYKINDTYVHSLSFCKLSFVAYLTNWHCDNINCCHNAIFIRILSICLGLPSVAQFAFQRYLSVANQIKTKYFWFKLNLINSYPINIHILIFVRHSWCSIHHGLHNFSHLLRCWQSRACIQTGFAKTCVQSLLVAVVYVLSLCVSV